MQPDLTPEHIRDQFSETGTRFALRADETTTSTNQVALGWLRAGIEGQPTLDFALVVAENQTQGRGRLNRTWHAEPGQALLFTLLMWDVPPAHLPWLSPIAALAVIAALRDGGALQGREAQVRLKWPNDVQVAVGASAPLKVCGILPEAVWDGAHLSGVALGIGLNVGGSFAGTPLQDTAISIEQMTGQVTDRARLLAALVSRIRALLRTPLPEIAAQYRTALATLGQPVRITQGNTVIEGVAEAVDDGGALLVRGGDGVLRRAIAGDLFMS